MGIRRWFASLFLFLLLSGGKVGLVTSEDVSEMLRQIMLYHASYKELTPELVKRAIVSFIEDLDPMKSYFLQEDVAPWLSLEGAELSQVFTQVQQENYAPFFQIQQKMREAITRRERLEEQCQSLSLPEKASLSEFKDLSWAASEELLIERLLKIKSLQEQSIETLDPQAKERAMQRIAKRRQLREEELSPIDSQELISLVLSHTMKAFASSFDTHTSYFTPGEATQFMIQVQQRLFGIGAQLRDDLNGFTIVKIIEGGPASLGTGLKVHDRVIAIDCEPVAGLEITDVVDLIRGEEGTVVTLTVLRTENEEEKRLEIPITRGEVVIQDARIESKTLPFGEGVIAYIALHAFYQDPTHSSGADLYEEISRIRKNHKVKGMILDLRDNSGGVLPQAVTVTGLFITKGIIVSIKDNLGHIEHLREFDGRMAYDGPLIVLTNKASASAAEIVAQTLQDYGRAIIVGDEYTYGKGTFQTFSLDTTQANRANPKGEFKVTRGRYYTVSGKSPQLVGVKPDIVVPGILSQLDIGEQHTKYPLENDSIAENFQDDLSDIPAIQREHINWLYRFNLQPRLKSYTKFLPLLRENSQQRLEADKLYQSFLGDLTKEDIDASRFELYAHEDPQLKEAINIMKDLIYLLS